MNSRQLAERLIARNRSESDPASSVSSVAALAAEDLFVALSRWVGADGCHALFTRAQTDELVAHPSLSSLQLRPRTQPHLDGVSATAIKYGEAETALAIQAAVVATIELLGRLIGAEMAANLIERTLPGPSYDGEHENNRARAQ